MAYKPILPDKQALKSCLDGILFYAPSPTAQPSIEDLIEFASLQMVVSEDLGRNYITSHKQTANQNLQTYRILSDITGGNNDLSSLMEVEESDLKMEKDGFKEYAWGTPYPPHRQKLDGLRRIANLMYTDIRVPFKSTGPYRDLVSSASTILELDKELFSYWRQVAELDETKIQPAEAGKVAVKIQEIIKRDWSAEGIKTGLRALLCLRDSHKDNEALPRLIVEAVDYALENRKVVGKHGKLFDDLSRIRMIYSGA